jgi:hypothetical protein
MRRHRSTSEAMRVPDSRRSARSSGVAGPPGGQHVGQIAGQGSNRRQRRVQLVRDALHRAPEAGQALGEDEVTLRQDFGGAVQIEDHDARASGLGQRKDEHLEEAFAGAGSQRKLAAAATLPGGGGGAGAGIGPTSVRPTRASPRGAAPGAEEGRRLGVLPDHVVGLDDLETDVEALEAQAQQHVRVASGAGL